MSIHDQQQRAAARRERQRQQRRIHVGHYHIASDCHAGQRNLEQVLAYATLLGVTEFMVIQGGDLMPPDEYVRKETIK